MPLHARTCHTCGCGLPHLPSFHKPVSCTASPLTGRAPRPSAASCLSASSAVCSASPTKSWKVSGQSAFCSPLLCLPRAHLYGQHSAEALWQVFLHRTPGMLRWSIPGVAVHLARTPLMLLYETLLHENFAVLVGVTSPSLAHFWWGLRLPRQGDLVKAMSH